MKCPHCGTEIKICLEATTSQRKRSTRNVQKSLKSAKSATKPARASKPKALSTKATVKTSTIDDLWRKEGRTFRQIGASAPAMQIVRKETSMLGTGLSDEYEGL